MPSNHPVPVPAEPIEKPVTKLHKKKDVPVSLKARNKIRREKKRYLRM